MFTRQHHNAIAKDIRTELEPLDPYESWDVAKIEALVHLALRFAKRFDDENAEFSPEKFLDACSINKTEYPFSELWEAYKNR